MDTIKKLYQQLERVNALSSKLEDTLKVTKKNSELSADERNEQTLACYIMRAALTRTQVAIIINLHALGEAQDLTV